ncbi:hypothetical protein CPB86DRAFT_788543 [Serendipita vermifera]|nr:hypothetical protein CPB86DRAFT_788543 [Serendipita vermifera]
MSFKLILSNNSVRNTTASCDSLGIYYGVSEAYGIVSVYRWKPEIESSILVGDIQYLSFRRDRIHLGYEDEWKVVTDFLWWSRNPFSSARIFLGNDGKEYRWTTRLGQLYMFNADWSGKPLVKYHRHLFHPSYLEIRDPSVISSLDSIFFSFLIVEKKRRDRQKRRHHSGGGGP